MQHTVEGMKRGEVELQQITLRDHAKNKEHDGTPDGVKQDGTSALASLSPPGKRKGQRHADHEHKQRPDHIEHVQSGPGYVLELFSERAGEASRPGAGEASHHELAADDPEHIEAAE